MPKCRSHRRSRRLVVGGRMEGGCTECRVRHREARREITEILADCGNGGSRNVGNVSSLYTTATGATTPTAPTALGPADTCQGRPPHIFKMYHEYIQYQMDLSKGEKHDWSDSQLKMILVTFNQTWSNVTVCVRMSDNVITDNGPTQTRFDHGACTWAFCRVWARPGCTIITWAFLRSLGWQPGTWSHRVHNPFLLRMSEMKKPLWPADYFYVGNDGLSISNPGHTISNLTLRQRRQKDNLFEVLKTFSSSQTNLFSFNTNFSCLTVTFSIPVNCKFRQ